MDWQPAYPLWASSVYVGAIGGTLAASRIVPWLTASTSGWGFPALLDLVEAEHASAPVLALSLALAFVLISVLPGLMSLFLITVTDVRLALHPPIGGGFFALSAGWVSQSVGGVLFGAVFGLVSLGLTATLLAARRHQDLQRDRGSIGTVR